MQQQATMYFNFAVRMFQQSNPVGSFLSSLMESVYFLATHRSNIKLQQYRKSLYQQQLEQMEGLLVEGSPYQYRGQKFNRRY